MSNWLWSAALAYAAFRKRILRATGLRLKGLGFLLRQLSTPRVFDACGFRWFLDPRIGGAFANLMSGAFMEPDTQDLLRHIADKSDGGFVFADVGANIGEMVLPMAAHANCTRVIAFEPHPICVEVLRENLRLNSLPKAIVQPVLVGDGTPQPYVIDGAASPNSGIRPDATGVALTPTVTLDGELGEVKNACVLLIDVEGAELDVMRGGQNFIRRSQPLIIFEYHDRTRERFTLDEVRAVIGDDYKLFRLRPDGTLDATLTDTWNCVAVHPASPFWVLMQERLCVGS